MLEKKSICQRSFGSRDNSDRREQSPGSIYAKVIKYNMPIEAYNVENRDSTTDFNAIHTNTWLTLFLWQCQDPNGCSQLNTQLSWFNLLSVCGRRFHTWLNPQLTE